MGLEKGKNSANGGGRFEFKELLIGKRWAVDRERWAVNQEVRVSREVRVNRGVEE